MFGSFSINISLLSSYSLKQNNLRLKSLMKARLGLRHFTRKQYIKPKHTKLFIGGKWEKSASGNKFTTIDPHTEEVITEVEEAGVEDVGRAVYAARKAFDEGPWRKFSGQQRAECLFKLAHLIDKHREELALLEALNNGKTLTNANMVDVERSIQSYKYFAGWADKVTGDTISAHGNFFAYTVKPFVQSPLCLVPLMKLGKSWSLTKFDTNLDYFLFE